MNDKNNDLLLVYCKIFLSILGVFCLASVFFVFMVFVTYFGCNTNMLLRVWEFICFYIFHPKDILEAFAFCTELMSDLDKTQSLEIMCVGAIVFFATLKAGQLIIKHLLVLSYRKIFISEKDLEKNRMFSGDFHCLGTSYQKPIRLPFNESVLNFIDSASFQLNNAILPNIFNNDDANMIIVDSTGELQKISAGYRGLLGKTLCFDWDNVNDAKSGNFLPSWNPFSAKIFPKEDELGVKYLNVLSNSILNAKQKTQANLSPILSFIMSFFYAKVEKAMANDYFLNVLVHNKYFKDDDKSALMSYYLLMPDKITDKAKDALITNEINERNYVPVGSWENIVESWRGKEINLPMIYDSLLAQVDAIKDFPEVKRNGLANTLFEKFKNEAELFNYAGVFKKFMTDLQDVNDSDFMNMLDALSFLKNQNIREKMIFTDFSYEELRGFSVDGTLYPITLYLSARTEDEKVICKILLNVIMSDIIEKFNNQNPIVIIIDDANDLGYINLLSDYLNFGDRSNASVLLYNTNIKQFKETYGENVYQDILNRTNYITVSADNTEKYFGLINNILTPKTKSMENSIIEAMNKLFKHGENNTLLINNTEMPFVVELRFFTFEEIQNYYNQCIISANPYIDDFIKSDRPIFFESQLVPSVFTETKRGRKKKNEQVSMATEWWKENITIDENTEDS